MAKVPWISRIGNKRCRSNDFDVRDTNTSEDPLGAVVEIGPHELVITEATKFTEIRQETTDDN